MKNPQFVEQVTALLEKEEEFIVVSKFTLSNYYEFSSGDLKISQIHYLTNTYNIYIGSTVD